MVLISNLMLYWVYIDHLTFKPYGSEDGTLLRQAYLQSISDKIPYLIPPDKGNVYPINDVQGTKVYHSLKENLTNLTSLGRKETLVTVESKIARSFELNHARGLMEEQFIQLVEEESEYTSQGKRKIGRKK